MSFQLQEMFKSYAITLCRVFITQQKISTSLRAKRYLCGICVILNSLFNWLVQLVQFCVFVCVWHVCVCVCVCVFLLYFLFLLLFNQLPYLKFHNKVFTKNWSQIWVFLEDLIKYILSWRNCNTIRKKKGNKNYKKKKKGNCFISHILY